MVVAEAGNCNHVPIGECHQRRIPAPEFHVCHRSPGQATRLEDQRVRQTVERVVSFGPAGGQQSAVGEKRLAHAEQVDRRVWRLEPRSRVLPDPGAELVLVVLVGIVAGASEEHTSPVCSNAAWTGLISVSKSRSRHTPM